ncbi:unnamed protein product [Pieris macdunnoughi]|uniref:unspecific monooxygenase n=1 Tax=Pieris macdunnoughi TaxID=345717 RepID=A0A821QLB5_9NEOP|nr:unnamed protein product [Pieris macdunnoughi]
MLLLIWTAVLCGILYIYLRQVYSRFSKHGVKYIKPLPILGNMAPTLLRKCHFVEDLENYYRKFPEERFVGRFEFMVPTVLVRDLDLMKKVTIKDFENFMDHRGFADEAVEPIFARNLFTLKGDEWKDMRSTLSPAFTSSKIRVMVPFMEEVGNQMMALLKKKIEANGGKAIEVDVKDLTTRYSNDVIATCAFGLKVDSYVEENNKFYEMGKIAASFKLRQMLMFMAYSAFPALVKKLKLTLFSKETTNFFITLVKDTMHAREVNHIIRPDMIHLLMEAKKGRLNHEAKDSVGDAGFATVEESDVGKTTVKREWTDNDLIAQAVLFFIAGFETISVAMCFTLHELALHPEVQDKLAKEIRDHIKNGGKIDFNSIQNLRYMDMVVSEVLRLWPPAIATDRICNKDYNLGKPNKNSTEDFIVRKGECLFLPIWSIHRDPNYFPNPEKFDPERFSDENKDKINPIAYLPFGVGPRNCIGSRFALCELKMLIFQIIQHMEVSPSPKSCIPAKLSLESFNLRLEGGHWLNFNIRE